MFCNKLPWTICMGGLRVMKFHGRGMAFVQIVFHIIQDTKNNSMIVSAFFLSNLFPVSACNE